MNSLLNPLALVVLVVGVMTLVNLINIPRGPVLHCYDNATTYTDRPASYGFPFVFIRGHIEGDDCSLVSGKIADQSYEVQPYAGYNVEQRALILNAGVTALLAGAAYFAGTRKKPAAVAHRKTTPSKRSRRHA